MHTILPRRTLIRRESIVLWGTLLFGCGDGEKATRDTAAATSAEGGTALPADPCLKAKPGKSCGEGRHCIEARCAENVCGDGVAAGTEECDDGNQVVGDGCSPSCKLRPLSCGDAVVDDAEECDDGNWFGEDTCSNDCTENRCGNGRQEGREECDDGNEVDDDGCSLKCTENRCRNGRLDPGEECDDGNQIHADGCSNGCLDLGCGNRRVDDATRGGDEECDDGNAVNDDGCANACTLNKCGNARVDPGEVCDGPTADLICSDDCKQATKNDACADCRNMNCRLFNDSLDLIAGCLEAPDQAFRDQCTAMIDCAKANDCGYDAVGAQYECFCGTADLGACQTEGVANGPCQAEWWAGSRTDSLADLVGNLSVIALPSGMAWYLMECEMTSCAEACVR